MLLLFLFELQRDGVEACTDEKACEMKRELFEGVNYGGLLKDILAVDVEHVQWRITRQYPAVISIRLTFFSFIIFTDKCI